MMASRRSPGEVLSLRSLSAYKPDFDDSGQSPPATERRGTPGADDQR